MHRFIDRFAFIVLLMAPAAAAQAQTSPPDSAAVAADRATGAALEDAGTDEHAARVLRAARAEEPPVVDGRLDDGAWERAGVATDFVQQEPEPGEPATERTEARILYDDEAVYVGVRLHDRSPGSIVARLARRDEHVFSDWVYVQLGSYRDGRTAFSFGTNPLGVQRDLLISEDDQRDIDWNAVWEVETTRDDAGWTAEFRIPLSQLRFNADNAVWGLNIERIVARTEEVSHWAAVPPDAPGFVTHFGRLAGLTDLPSPYRVELMPYTVGRLTRAPGDAADPYYRENALFGSAGADLEYGLTSDLTLSATINPDFGQVEADPSQVNLTAYETFLPEKRPFFNEGTDVFDANGPRLFYSRRIGRRPQASVPGDAVHTDSPDRTTILGAAKLTGRTAGGWSVGALNAVTAEEEAVYVDGGDREHAAPIEPLTNYFVGRAERNLDDGRSSIGGMLTATNRRLGDSPRFDALHSAAYAGLVDGRHRFAGGDYEVDATLLGSYVRGDAEALARTQRSSARYFQRPDADHVEYDSSRTSLAGYAANALFRKVGGGHWRWGAGVNASSPGFEINDLGFHRSSDAARQMARVGYEQFRSGRVFRQWSLRLQQWSDWTFGGERTGLGGNIHGNFQLQSYWRGDASVGWELPARSPDALRGGPALRTPASGSAHFHIYTDHRRPVRLGLGGWANVERGTDGRVLRLEPSIDVRSSPRSEVSLQPNLVRRTNPRQFVGRPTVDGEARYLMARIDQTTMSLTTRFSYTFSPTLSLQLYAQPFLSAGDYSEFREVRDPRAEDFDGRFRTYGADRLTYDDESGRYDVDANGDGAADFGFPDPDFSIGELRSNAVLRWEWQPGSTLFLVWSQGRSRSGAGGTLAPGDDVRQLLETPGTNTLLVKVSYWFGL